MSKESQALLNEFHSIVNSNVDDLVESMLIKRDVQNPLLRLTKDEIGVLQTMSLSSLQIDVLRKGMLALGRGIVFSLLCIVDGVSYGHSELPDLALVERNTKIDISEQFLHDEFIGLLKDD